VKISLLELTVSDTSAIGVRSLSAYLKKAGFQVRLVFLGAAGEKNEAGIYLYKDTLIKQVVDLCKDSDLIGISFLTSGFHRAAQLTERFKKDLKVPVVWGGLHSTVESEQCLEWADGVCRGEGEDALLELVKALDAGRDYHHIQNFWFKKDGEIIKNPFRPLMQDLDSLPFLDYDPAGEHYAYAREKDTILPLEKDLLLDLLTLKWQRAWIRHKPIYYAMASRGCPNSCAFCFHSIYKSIYPRQRYIRRRSPSNIVKELRDFIDSYNFKGVIWFADDDFLAATTNEIKEFSELYKRDIGLPFFCLCSPNTMSEKKLAFLTDAGLGFFELGIQTGATKTKKRFNRVFSSERILESCKLLNQFKDKIPMPYYDFILDSPWETLEDQMETLDLILQIPKPYGLGLASFRYFPGSHLYEEAKKEGLISIDSNQIYSGDFLGLKGNYINALIFLYTVYKVPRSLIRLLSNRKVAGMMNRNSLAGFYRGIYLAHKIFNHLFR
jgi:anaerobic magnesium-protoporphyrin IX monomethyl ester cyclase